MQAPARFDETLRLGSVVDFVYGTESSVYLGLVSTVAVVFLKKSITHLNFDRTS